MTCRTSLILSDRRKKPVLLLQRKQHAQILLLVFSGRLMVAVNSFSSSRLRMKL